MVLTQLDPGQQARIVSMHFLDKEVRHRLLVLGVMPESEITFVRKWPMKGPIQCRCKGQTFALTRAISDSIEVCVL